MPLLAWRQAASPKNVSQSTSAYLSQSPIRSGATPALAVQETLRLATAAETLGYRRYWVAEHHSSNGLAGSTPEILVGRIAAETSTIRVGAGGVMLSHYSPLKVAEVFRLLETLYPGRIDLGIGRAPGSDQITAAALGYGSQVGIEYFPTRIADMIAFLSDEPPPTEAFSRVRATPKCETVPDIWLLGSSGGSAQYASQFGLPFSFAQFINPHDGVDVLAAYRESFQPSGLYDKPKASISVFVLCAEDEEEAQYLATSRHYWRLRLEKGLHGPYPTPEEAAAFPYTPADRARLEDIKTYSVVGTPAQVKERLIAMAKRFEVEEIVVLSISHDFGARVRSYELVAEALGLEARP